jgi:hypothetical protein
MGQAFVQITMFLLYVYIIVITHGSQNINVAVLPLELWLFYWENCSGIEMCKHCISISDSEKKLIDDVQKMKAVFS